MLINGRWYSETEIRTYIDRLQAEINDLKTVKRGHWIPQYVSSRGLTDKFACSVCNTMTYTSHKYLNCFYKYCNECGARMVDDNGS